MNENINWEKVAVISFLVIILALLFTGVITVIKTN